MVNPEKSPKPEKGREDSRKIWVTLPTKYADILDVIAEEPSTKQRSNRKAVIIEKMIEEYTEIHKQELMDDRRWDMIINIRMREAKRVSITTAGKIKEIEAFLYSDSYKNRDEVKPLIRDWEESKDLDDDGLVDMVYQEVQNVRSKFAKMKRQDMLNRKKRK